MAFELEKAFNLSILNLVPANLVGLGQVDTLDAFDVTGEFHPRGLYSIDYFGPVGDIRRARRVAYIDIKADVLHPLIYSSIIKLKAFYGDIITGKRYAVWDPKARDFVVSDPMQGGRTGYNFFMSHWREIEFTKNRSTRRNERVEFIERYKAVATTRRILVIPAALRDMTTGSDGRPSSDEVNKIYQRLIGGANTLTDAGLKHNPEFFDNALLRLQLTFNELFQYFTELISGKRKLIMGKWLSRRIHNGTSNVLSAYVPTIRKLGEPGAVSVNNTIVGLHQFLVSTGQMTNFWLKSGILGQALRSVDLPAMLVDPDTLQQKAVHLDAEEYDYWMSNEGIDKLIERYENREIRHEPVRIAGCYLALVYTDELENLKVFNDIRDLPDNLPRERVRPISLIELLYLSCYADSGDIPGFPTRYPISGDGSIYPSFSYVKTTSDSERRYFLSDDWVTRDPERPVMHEFPVPGSSFYDTLTPNTTRLAGMGGDYDGDRGSYNTVITDEARAEVRNYFKAARAWFNVGGGLRMSAAIPTIELVVRNMTERN